MNDKKKISTKKIITLAVVALAGAFVAINLINANRTEAVDGIPHNALPVQWTHPQRQTIVSRVNARGMVDFVERHTVFAETSAQISQVHVRVGDTVEVGDVLVTYNARALDTLHDTLAQAELALQQTEVASRQAEFGLAATTLAPSDVELLTAENAINQARANIANIEAQLEQLDLQMAQIREDIQTAKKTRTDVEILFEAGISTRVELENAKEAMRRVESQLEILRSQWGSVAFGMIAALESERIAVLQHEAIRNRNYQPAAVNQAQVQQLNIEQSRLNIEQARLNIAQIQRSIDEFKIKEISTVEGTVISVFVRAGYVSTIGRSLVEIADVSSDNLVVVVPVPENNVGNIDIGQEVEISGGALGRHVYIGYVSLIYPVAASRQMGATLETVITVEISVKNTERLYPGITVDAEIITNINEDTLVVPLMSTLREGGGVNFVYVIGEASTLVRRDITFGEFSDMYIEVYGVTDEDRVILNPNHGMYEGMHVRPLA